MLKAKANEIQDFWEIEIDGQKFQATTEQAQAVFEMTVEQGDSYEIHQGRDMKINVGRALGLDGLARVRKDNEMVVRG